MLPFWLAIRMNRVTLVSRTFGRVGPARQSLTDLTRVRARSVLRRGSCRRCRLGDCFIFSPRCPFGLVLLFGLGLGFGLRLCNRRDPPGYVMNSSGARVLTCDGSGVLLSHGADLYSSDNGSGGTRMSFRFTLTLNRSNTVERVKES